MIELIKGLPDRVVGLEAIGEVTSSDYEHRGGDGPRSAPCSGQGLRIVDPRGCEAPLDVRGRGREGLGRGVRAINRRGEIGTGRREMEMSERDMLLVLGASYDTREAAEADYEAIKALYREVEVTHDFDAAVVERDPEGKVHVIRKHEEPTRHGVVRGLGWGLAIGAATAIFPAVGLAGGLVAGGGAGAAIGAVKGHMRKGLKDDDLKQLGEVLEKGQFGLVAVYATNMADQIAANIKAVNRYVSAEIDASADELAAEIKAVEGEGA